MKRKVGRPKKNPDELKNKTVSFRISQNTEKAVKRLTNNNKLNTAMNELLDNLESNIVFINEDEKQVLNDGLGIEDPVAYYSAIILNDLEEARHNIIENQNQAIEQYIDVGFEHESSSTHYNEW
ncbi:hypothetical protein [uncultured Pseudoalteromonas sp.]|uniref:hypothetical protein n=1 Tax=uncultured Pseudoalteromonas sp. TaxID=114053 RepID=UPI0025959FF5|nr:hypothetical protein [uncultured Pseudoalteromonas sp.]